MNQEIKLKRKKLLNDCMELRIIAKDPKAKNSNKIYKLQKEKWKEYNFFDNYIKIKEKIK